MDEQYWSQFYADDGVTREPSLFAKLVCGKYIQAGERCIELGCGNGRDASFFAANGLDVLAVDQCENEIVDLSNNNSFPNLRYVADDFTQLGNLGFFDAVYSRFTLHSVSEEGENRAIAWCALYLNKGGHLCIEVRGKKNELFQRGKSVPGEPDAFIYDDHYRRFVDKEKLEEKLEKNNFQIIISEERNGFAPYNGEDHAFLRIIARKK